MAIKMLLTAKDLVATLATEDHFHAHGLDLPAEKIHGRARTDGGDIERLKVVDDVGNRIETFLDGERILVVDGAQEMRRLSGGQQVRRVL